MELPNKKINYGKTLINLLLIVFCVTLSAVATVKVGGTQVASSDACFTHIFVTNGKGKIDLIGGDVAKVYSLQAPIWVNFTILNENCTTNGFNYANFVINVTENGITDSWPLEKVFKGSSKDLSLAYPYGMEGPKVVNLKAELFLNQTGIYFLEDVRYFSIEVVWLSMEESSIDLSLVEICQTDNFTLTMKIQNVGNDVAYATNIAINDPNGLSVIGDSSLPLGDLNANEICEASFGFSVPLHASLGVHYLTFTCTYNDFSQTLRRNSITTQIMVRDASTKQGAQNLIDQVESKIEKTRDSLFSGYWNKDAKNKLNEAITEYDKSLSLYNAGNYTYAAYYANKAIDLLKEANRIELIFRMPAYIGLALACVLVAIIIYALLKR